jgi:hypothetical protein
MTVVPKRPNRSESSERRSARWPTVGAAVCQLLGLDADRIRRLQLDISTTGDAVATVTYVAVDAVQGDPGPVRYAISRLPTEEEGE